MLVGEVWARMGLDSREYEKGLSKMEGYTRQKALTLGSIFKGAFSFAMGIGIVQGFRSLGGAITDFVNTAARTEVLDVAMQSVARSSGYAISALREQRKEVMELGIAEQEASQILTRFMQAQLDTADAAKLARVAQDAAVISGTNSSQTAEQMTEAIAKQRPELLSAYGMTRNMNEIYKDYAGTVGKTAVQLSEAEKKQAMLNYILKEGEKIAGTYEASMGVVGKQISSLPRYWDTLKNAIAKPLALPVLSLIVDGITNSLKNAIAWAEANKAILQRWGQTAVNIVSAVGRYFAWWYGVLRNNWTMIKLVGVALLTYVAAMKVVTVVTTIARTATWAFGLAMSVLRGHSVITGGALGFLSTAVQAYRYQMALAPVATNILTAALYKVQAAAYAAQAALGPVGWILLVISALVSGGVFLWNKYATSVRAGADAANKARMDKFTKQQEALAEASLDAAGGQGKLGDALKKAAKAAGKSLQSFDEVHTLQQDMGGLDDMPDLDMPGLDIPELGLPDMGDMLAGFGAGLEEVKGTFKGFLQWIWGYVTDWFKDWNWWEILLFCLGPAFQIGLLIYKNWDKIVAWVKETLGPLFAPIGEAWGRFVAWAGGIWDGVKAKWENFKTSASEIWENLKTTIQTKWEDLKNKAGEIWTNIKTTIKTKWDELKTGAKAIWENIKTEISTRWEALKTGAETIWNNIKTGIITKWEDLKAFATNIWETIKSTVLEKWEALKTGAGTAWTTMTTTITGWVTTARDKVLEVWENIKKKLSDTWESIKETAGKVWDGIYGAIKAPINLIIGAINTLIRGLNRISFDIPAWKAIPAEFRGKTWGISIPEVPLLAQGGIVTRPTLAMMGEAGAEAVIPLGRSGFATDIADSVAQAVYSAIRDAIRVSRIEQGGGSQGRERQQEIVLEIDGTRIGRAILPALISESQRLGGGPIIQLQGG